ncbi:helix-turn-helix domain-containing protein [Nocardia sp. CDC160]|uniref:helix-turn-helix domain-containing protein n=1 Tax=Nocardia sp. CDC160 TaxID=3112166 RepID=UPI002DBD6D51|nr:helix-turn-helix domain-containing protein [Nocardia sp. CDC160]MEC3916414.1 helix-turn-helix domain-containing protein [Nocardia sp. CDC160]
MAATDHPEQPATLGPFAARLNLLFDRWAEKHGRALRNSDLAAGLTSAGHRISKAYVSQLRRGIRTNPSTALLEALAAFFGVPIDYFLGYDTVGCGSGDIDIPGGLIQPSLRRLVSTASGLSPAALEYLATIADALRLAEDLPGRPEVADL